LGKINKSHSYILRDFRSKVMDYSVLAANYINSESSECPGYGPQPYASFLGRVSLLVNNFSCLLKSKNRLGSLNSASSCASAIDLNISLYNLTNNKENLIYAEKGVNWLLNNQKEGGFWFFNKFEGKGVRIQTVDNAHGALSLLRFFRLTKQKKVLRSALSFCEYIRNEGRVEYGNRKVFYKYYLDGEYENLRVTNISCLLISLFTEAYRLTKKEKYIDWANELVPFIKEMQRPDGELCYSSNREQYQGPQYNAFQFIFLSSYYNITRNKIIDRVMRRMSSYLINSVNDDGSIKYGNIGWGYNSDGRSAYYHSFAVSKAIRISDQLFGTSNNKHIFQTTMFGLRSFNTEGSYPYGKATLFGLIDDIVPYPRYIGYCGNLALSAWYDTEYHNYNKNE